jgi:hypothetical protein
MSMYSLVMMPALLLAQTPAASSLTAREFDWPTSPGGLSLLILGSLAIVSWVVWLYRRDTREIGLSWCWVLAGLRLTALLGLLIIALNPQDRTQRSSFRPSRVVLLVDTSLSMRHPAEGQASPSTTENSRSRVVQKALAEGPLITQLQREHEVSLYTFDSALKGPLQVFPHQPADGNAATTARPANAAEWSAALEPQGTETRLGEALGEVLRQSAGRTLSGVVVISDGGQNAGVDTVTVHDRAVATKTRLIAAGLGTVEQPLNVQIADVQSPTDVQLGDSFDFTAYLQGQGLAGREMTVDLYAAQDGENNPATLLASQVVTLPAEGLSTELKFPIKPIAEGGWKYRLQVTPVAAVNELNLEDNQQTVSLRVFDRPTRVLLIAGGPMRDYQFVRNLLYRHQGTEVDVWLQTAAVGSSQESKTLLAKFPETREALFEYDVIIAFDPDWRSVSAEGIEHLTDWVYQEGGGLILVAGDVYTTQVAASAQQATPLQAQLASLLELYPVVLYAYANDRMNTGTASQPWPLAFSTEGQRAEFLQLTDDPVTSLARWKEFAGFYRCYPTMGAKAGATILANFSDPRAQNEFGPPILLAQQFYGQGRTFYIGSGEFWRLRSVSDADYDRFWIKTLREVGQGRSKRGTKRGVILPESRKLLLGQTARLRARLLDAQFQPLDMDEVKLQVYGPNGRPFAQPPVLRKDPARPGEYTGDFRVSLTGLYKVELAIPQSSDVITEELTVALPKLEDQDVRQNVSLLQDLVRDTGGTYLPWNEAEAALPGLLPSKGEPFTIDERLQTLWDRDWVMYLLVGLLSLEWLARKLLKLA